MRRAVSIALAGATLTLIALTFATAPLLVPGIAFILIGVAAPVWVRMASAGACVERHLERRRVVEGEPLEARIEVSAPWLALAAAEVIEPLAPVTIPLNAGERGRSFLVVLSFARRGRHPIAPPSLVVHDPLDLARRVIGGRERESELLVLPRTSPVRSLAGASGGRGNEAAGARAKALAAVDLDGLRPYRPGTPAARIHWPAVARGAGLLERRLRAETDTRPLIVLDARGAASIEHLDQAVRAAASLVLELARAGGCGLLIPGERRPTSIASDLSAWPAAHARLAVVRGGPECPAPALGSARARLGPVFYIAAQSLERLPPAAHGIARGAGVLVLPAPLAGPLSTPQRPIRASFEVAGCLGYMTRPWRQQRLGDALATRPAAAGGSAL